MPQLNSDPSAQLWPHDLLQKLKTHMTSGYKKVSLLFRFCFAEAIFDKQSNPLFKIGCRALQSLNLFNILMCCLGEWNVLDLICADIFLSLTHLPVLPDDITMVICPGIGNHSEKHYIRTFVDYAQKDGYRCAVLNHLGALPNIELTSPRMFTYGETHDLTSSLLYYWEMNL